MSWYANYLNQHFEGLVFRSLRVGQPNLVDPSATLSILAALSSLKIWPYVHCFCNGTPSSGSLRFEFCLGSLVWGREGFQALGELYLAFAVMDIVIASG